MALGCDSQTQCSEPNNQPMKQSQALKPEAPQSQFSNRTSVWPLRLRFQSKAVTIGTTTTSSSQEANNKMNGSSNDGIIEEHSDTRKAKRYVAKSSAQVVIRRFSQEQCRQNPCLNGGKCIPGKISCECPKGWMGRFCHRRCRNIYQSCDRWAMEEKCELVRTQTNFFDINCAVSCKMCAADPSVKLSPIPLAPALEPLQFMVGKWYSQAAKGLRFPTDMKAAEYEEVLDIMPAEVPMFGAPSINLTSTSWFGEDVRVTHGFLTLKPNSFPPEVAILSTANEGLNMIELGLLQNHAVTLNISYMQVHPSMENDALPLGATRRFKRSGQFLEMTVAKLLTNNRVSQFKKMFRKLRNYPF